MPATTEEIQRESRASAVTALLTLACGICLMYVSWNGWHSQSVEVVDHLVKFASARPDLGQMELPPLTTQRIMQSLFTMSILVVIAAVVGIIGALMRQKGPVCTYVILASCLSLVVLTSSAQTTQRRWLAGPLVLEQADDLCNASTFIRFASSLGCDFASSFHASELTPCDATCRYRVGILRENHGCEVLSTLCARFTYDPLQGGGCLTAAMNTGLAAYRHTGTPLSADGCHRACDFDIGCDTYVMFRQANGRTQCIVLSVRGSFMDPANWTKMPDDWRQKMPTSGLAALMKQPIREQPQPGQPVEVAQRDAIEPDHAGGLTHQCFRRKDPEVLVEFLGIGLQLALATTVLGILLLLSTFCTCCILYNVNMSRRGLPTAIELGLMMMCPCCSEHISRRFNEDFFDHHLKTSDEDDSEDDEESRSDGK